MTAAVKNYDKLQTLLAGADLTGKEFSLIKAGASDAVLAGKGEAADGVVVNVNVSGKPIGALTEPGQKILLRTGAAVAKGDFLTADASGRVVKAVDGDHIVARALQAATAADQFITGVFQPLGKLDNHRVTLKGAIIAATTTSGGDAISLANPFGERAIIDDVFLDVTTPATGAATMDVGVAADGTTSSDTLLDAADVGTAAIIANNVDHKGVNGGKGRAWSASQFITATPSATLAGLVGEYYVTVFLPTAK